jgi:hypothetical protein
MDKKIILHGHSPGPPRVDTFENQLKRRIFLLSPANLKGVRAQGLYQPRSASELNMRLRAGRATLGEIFSFTSSLYFRGKLAYARAFGTAQSGLEACYLITSTRGLLLPDTLVDLAMLKELTAIVDLDPEDDRYRIPLERDATALNEKLEGAGEVILLGSVATPKYVKPLLAVFGTRLLFPSVFAGRGNMSRGGLLLRSVREGRELRYVSIAGLAASIDKKLHRSTERNS